MKKSFSKNYKIGKLRISVFNDEIVFVYTGKNRIHIKTYQKKSFKITGKTAFLFIAFTTIVIIIILSSSDNVKSSKKHVDEIKVSITLDDTESDGDESFLDEEQKNKLLESVETDFSVQKEVPELQIYKHKVQKGEVLSEIAKKYGISMDTICGSNNLISYDLIKEGAVFTIPSKDGILYKMKKGVTILDLVKKYKISLKKILAQNSIKNPDFISIGSELFIPDARPQNIFPGYLWPTFSRKITGGYGWRRNPFNRRRREFHKGVDIGSKYGRVRATKYGKITYSGWLGGYGKVIIIGHPGGIKSLYAHLSKIFVRKGQYVKQGQFIGRSGNTGRSTGPHLHVEITKYGKHKNPFIYLNKKR